MNMQGFLLVDNLLNEIIRLKKVNKKLKRK